MAARNSKTPTSPHQPASNPNILYLEVTFSQNCTFTQDLNEILNKARNIANLLYRIRGRIRDCDPKTLYHTYKSFIRLVIVYQAPIYAPLYPARLRDLQNRYITSTLNFTNPTTRQIPSSTSQLTFSPPTTGT
ncbi:hypothetical protein MTP99_009625 [Tenebrio molitor]|jgi:hypothetical protein|nr:hypothetical protein MTP99_009625 [Tenebrio molitor]